MMYYHKGGWFVPSLHVHQYEGNTSCNDRHSHTIAGISGPPIPLPGGGHVHAIQGRTAFKDGHHHLYGVYSGPNIELPGGYHVHLVRLQTSVDDGHCHTFVEYDMASKTERGY